MKRVDVHSGNLHTLLKAQQIIQSVQRNGLTFIIIISSSSSSSSISSKFVLFNTLTWQATAATEYI
jgi:hypothetical protein